MSIAGKPKQCEHFVSGIRRFEDRGIEEKALKGIRSPRTFFDSIYERCIEPAGGVSSSIISFVFKDFMTVSASEILEYACHYSLIYLEVSKHHTNLPSILNFLYEPNSVKPGRLKNSRRAADFTYGRSSQDADRTFCAVNWQLISLKCLIVFSRLMMKGSATLPNFAECPSQARTCSARE